MKYARFMCKIALKLSMRINYNYKNPEINKLSISIII